MTWRYRRHATPAFALRVRLRRCEAGGWTCWRRVVVTWPLPACVRHYTADLDRLAAALAALRREHVRSMQDTPAAVHLLGPTTSVPSPSSGAFTHGLRLAAPGTGGTSPAGPVQRAAVSDSSVSAAAGDQAGPDGGSF
ncbi:MAG: hypothetical protein ACRDYZ_00740 [Acidimicrobiales bacterium]